jgi:hypothetical protein
MPRHLDDLRCKQDQFIHALYSVTQGDTRTCGDVRTITQKLGYDRHTCTSIVRYFLNKRIIEVTFSAVTHVFETTLPDCADGAACVFDGSIRPHRKSH